MVETVTERIKELKQPRGGYFGPKFFAKTEIDDGRTLFADENLHGTIVGSAVDYLTRISLGSDPKTAFSTSLKGAANLGLRKDMEYVGEPARAKKLAAEVKGLDDRSIINACMLSGYDVCYRRGSDFYKPVEMLTPDDSTIRNIRTLVERAVETITADGPVVLMGTEVKSESARFSGLGEIDYMTENTLWDLKVRKAKPDAKQTLQILVYYLMGKREGEHKELFSNLRYLGIINSRLGLVYRTSIADIPQETIDDVEKAVIGF